MSLVRQVLLNPYPLLIGLFVTLAIGLLIRPILDSIEQGIEIPKPEGAGSKFWKDLIGIPGKGTAGWLGFADRMIFFIAFLVPVPELIFAWLAFKLAAKWETWTNIHRVPSKLEDIDPNEWFLARTKWGARTMQRFLAGTGLNLLSAFVGVAAFHFFTEFWKLCGRRCW